MCRSRRAFFYDQVVRTGHEPRKDELMAVGQVFLPRTDFGAQETCRTIVESEVLRMGYYIYGWRHVPVDVTVPGRKGQRDPARDRADHHLQRQGRGRGNLRARALRHPPPDREGRGRRGSRSFTCVR
jgi:glutamate synthase domain-containing protein 1